MVMDEKILTTASIKANDSSMMIEFPETKKFESAEYILVIRADTTNFTRLMIYPIGSKKILKFLYSIPQKNVEKMRKLASDFKNYQIIHNSGIILKQNNFIGEIYFDICYSESKYKDLKAYLDKNKSIFEKIEFKEIGFQK